MNKIELPNERFEDPTDFLKGHNYEIDTSKKGKLGEGKYGVVYKAYKITDTLKKVLVCKVMTIDELIEEKMLRSLRNELYTLQRIRHDNIIELYEHFLIEQTQSYSREMNAYIFMQFADIGSLEAKIKGNEQINDYEVKRYFGQIVNGVSYMHRRLTAHRDLKLDNILLLETNGLINVKVPDFGMSQIAYRLDKGFIPMTKYKGTREYMSPQIIRLIVFKGQNYNYNAYKADIWALGVCLYRLLTAKYPFYLKTKTLSETKQMLKDQENKNWSYPKYLKIDPKVDDLLNRLLEPN
jgi:serine/threonine protein kinase